MTIPNITIEQLLEAGVHLGHKTLRWNPKMKKYIFGRRDTIHIIDLTQTVELVKQALQKVYETISNREKIPFSTLILPTYNNFILSKSAGLLFENHFSVNCEGYTIFPFFPFNTFSLQPIKCEILDTTENIR